MLQIPVACVLSGSHFREIPLQAGNMYELVDLCRPKVMAFSNRRAVVFSPLLEIYCASIHLSRLYHYASSIYVISGL